MMESPILTRPASLHFTGRRHCAARQHLPLRSVVEQFIVKFERAGGPSSNPFLISLGSVGNTLYGLDTNSSCLIAFDPNTGTPSVIGGTAGSITTGTLLDGTARSRFSGFASLTGVDSNADGQYDRLFGGVNFFDDDNNPGTPTIRYGGVAEFNLTNGSWQLIGNNPSLIYFGMAAAPVPEPTMALVAAAAGMIRMIRRWSGKRGERPRYNNSTITVLYFCKMSRFLRVMRRM
jgi:hypothetical protein